MNILRRVFSGLLLIIGVIALNFFLLQLAPGDTAEAIAGSMGGASEELLAEIRQTYGLDKPVLSQLFIYLGDVITFDLGTSYFYNQPVSSLIAQRIGPTILLVLSAIFLSLCIGVPLGVMAAEKPSGGLSYSVTLLALVGYATPVFWSGLMFVIFFASVIPIFPVQGFEDISLRKASFFVRSLDVLHHLILPAITLAIIYLAQYSRMARASMIETLSSDYIRTARAKGLSELTVVYKHGLRNAVLPIITLAGLQFGNLLSGAILVETVFNWPGLGRLIFDAILARDYPTILGVLIISSVMVIVANMLSDMGYRLADPRILKQG